MIFYDVLLNFIQTKRKIDCSKRLSPTKPINPSVRSGSNCNFKEKFSPTQNYARFVGEKINLDLNAQ